MPRATKGVKAPRHDPLYTELDQDEDLKKYGRVSQPGKRSKKKNQRSDDEDEEIVLDPQTSRKIFKLANEQQEELSGTDDDEEVTPTASRTHSRSIPTFDEDEDDLDENADPPDEYEELEIDAEDLNALETYLPADAGARRILADMIFEKLEAGDTPMGADDDGGPPGKKVRIAKDAHPDPAAGLDPKIVETYTKIGIFMSKGHYKSGPLPKPFKILPSLPNWARLLALTSPHNWSPQATNSATKVLVSNLKPEQAKVYVEMVVLENVREHIRDNQGKLNVHLYDAMKKSLYKPAAFFKGLLFPLCEGGCTLKEAAIVASVLAKVSIPALHSSAALHRLARMEYSGPNSLFIRVLLDKKHALPYKVVDEMVFHFIRLANTHKGNKADGEKLPVLWHQSLLVFCQRYASDLTPDQKDALLDVIRVRPHAQISPEIRRELVRAVCRGEARPTDEDVEMS